MQIKNYEQDFKIRTQEMQRYKVVKSNELIQKSRFNLSAQEQKIVLFLISRIKPTDKEFYYQDFSVAEFCSICGIDSANGKNYKNIKNAIKSLSDKSVWVTKDGSEKLFRWITEADVQIYSGTIRIKLQESMREHLLELQEHFTQYELAHALGLKSQYSIRVYELLKSHEYKRRCEFEIVKLKKALSAENYTRFPDFKRKVLEVSKREINEITDLMVEYNAVKDKRKYSSIEFTVRVKTPDEYMAIMR